MTSKLLERSGIEFVSMSNLMKPATVLAVELSYPAYDCIYLAVARQIGASFVTADQRLLRIAGERASDELACLCVSLTDV